MLEFLKYIFNICLEYIYIYIYIYIYSQNDGHSNRHRFSEIRLYPKIAYYRDCFITNYLEMIQFGLFIT